jgi:Helicase HerA, central domain
MVIPDLNLGLLRVVSRAPELLWKAGRGMAVIKTGSLGFAGAEEADRMRSINSFRRLLDGLDGPLQVLIEVIPGSGSPDDARASPSDFDDMRGADMWFVDQLSQSSTAHRLETSLITSEPHAKRLEPALLEIGVPFEVNPSHEEQYFGKELANRYLHSGGHSRTWYVERLPGTELEAGWLFRLLPPGLRLRLAWHASPLPVGWIVDYLQRQLINMRATRLAEHDSGSPDPLLAGALPNAEDLQRRLASSQDKAFHVAVYLSLTCAGLEELEAGATRVESAARAVLCRLQPCLLRMFDGYLATQAQGIDRLGRKRVLDTSTLVTFFPWLEPDLQQQGGLVIGRNLATGSPVLVDPFDQRRYANANIGVFGHSGAGKTYLLSALLLGALGRGVQVFVIDPEHEYGGLARNVGGVEVDLALGSGHALNVLDLRPSDSRDEAWLGPAAADAIDLCSTICGGLDESERALLERSVRAVYGELDQPVLRDVADRLPDGSRVATILRRWVHGSLGQMFSSPTNVDLEAPIVTFGMRELREEMVAPVHFLLAEALWTRIKRKDHRRMLVIDELGLLFEDPTIRRFVVSLARRIRKYDGSLVYATQNPGDLLSSEQGRVVATNPAVVFFGAQRPGEAARLQETFHLSARQRAFLEAGRRGDFLLAAGAERLAVQVQAPPWQEDAMRRSRGAGSTATPSA